MTNRWNCEVDSSSLVLCPQAGPGIEHLHATLSSALLFIFTYDPSFGSSIIPNLGLPLGLFPSILPSRTWFNNPSPLTACPIQFFFLFQTDSNKLLFSSVVSSISWLVFLSTQLIYSILLHIHISNASNLSISLVVDWKKIKRPVKDGKLRMTNLSRGAALGFSPRAPHCVATPLSQFNYKYAHKFNMFWRSCFKWKCACVL